VFSCSRQCVSPPSLSALSVPVCYLFSAEMTLKVVLNMQHSTLQDRTLTNAITREARAKRELKKENCNVTRKHKWQDNTDKNYVLSKSESVQCNFFIFDHVTFIQFKICCCVQNFIEIGWFFAEIWRYNDFQNGGRPARPLSWNCFTIIRDHPRSLCCWPQLPVKFHVSRIGYTDLKI